MLAKWVIKLWVLADSSNGYTVDFNVHVGRAAGQKTSEFNQVMMMVMLRLLAFSKSGLPFLCQ